LSACASSGSDVRRPPRSPPMWTAWVCKGGTWRRPFDASTARRKDWCTTRVPSRSTSTGTLSGRTTHHCLLIDQHIHGADVATKVVGVSVGPTEFCGQDLEVVLR